MVEACRDGNAIFENSRLLYSSPSYQQLLGYSPQELSLLKMLKYIHKEDLPHIIEKIRYGRQQKLSQQNFCYRIRHQQGHYIWLEDLIHRQFDDEGRESRVIINSRNITDRITQEQKLQNDLSEKELFFRELQHRVRNNLSMLSSMLELETYHISDRSLKNIIWNHADRIKATAALYEMLYSRGDINEIDVKEYLNQLTQKEFDSTYEKSREIQIKLNGKSILCQIDIGIKLGIIIHELMQQSIQYSFINHSKQEKKIELHWQRQANDQIQFHYFDNGNYPNMIQKEKEKASFSMKIIKTLLNKYPLEFRDNQPGFSCQFSLPMK